MIADCSKGENHMFFFGWQGVYALIGIVLVVVLIVAGFARLLAKQDKNPDIRQHA